MSRVRTMTASAAALALATALTVGAFAQDEPEPIGDFSIEDINWLLTAQVADSQLTPLDEGVVISLRMADGQAGGTGGCNAYGASYELDGSDVTIHLNGSTAMGCGAPHAAAEGAYFGNLDEVASYQSDGIEMALRDEAGELLLEFGVAPASWVEGPWRVDMISDGAGSLEGDQHTSKVTATFGEDGSLTGTDGCNDYSTMYELDGQEIRIGRIVTTEKACTKPPAKNARRYYTALEATTTWSIGMHGLQLQDDDGAVQVMYYRAE